MREGNLWLARSQALESGHLSVVLIHARRASPSGRDATGEIADMPEDAAAATDDIAMDRGHEE